MPASTNDRDYYVVLGISSSADASEVRRAYREQALAHHPDKNPDRVEEATERFQLIAEAYSFLQDAQQRAAYDAGCSTDDTNESSDDASSTKFSDKRARDLFQDIFGDEVAHAVQRVKSGVVTRCNSMQSCTSAGVAKAAVHCGKWGVVRKAVAAGLSPLTLEADSNAEDRAHEEELSKLYWQKRVKMLRDHDESVATAQKENLRKRANIFERLPWRKNVSEETAYENKMAAQKTALLRKMVREALADYKDKHEKFEEAKDAALSARKEVEDVQRNGASIERAKQAGALLFSRLSRKVRRTNSSYRSGKTQVERNGSARSQRAHSCRF